MASVRYPSLYQINTRVWLTVLSRTLGKPATLDDIPDDALDRLAEKGFDWIWLLSVWQTGLAAQKISRQNPEWRREFKETLPDLADDDIPGSGFAIAGYTVHKALGGDAALARLRARLKKRGLRLMLDFVPNHMAPDHPWVEDHPEHFVKGTRTSTSPGRAAELHRGRAARRGTSCSPWAAILAPPELARHAAAQLPPIPDAGGDDRRARPYRRSMRRRPLRHGDARPSRSLRAAPGASALRSSWPTARRERVRARKTPGFLFMAEVYWDLEWTLQQQGFDYAYDKRLYDRLREQHTRPVREHFQAGLDYQDKLARFLENHDEPRAAATFAPVVHRAAAVITFLSPGLRFFHQGQFEGRKKRIPRRTISGRAAPANRSTRICASSTASSWPFCDNRRFAMGPVGGSSIARAPGVGRQLDERLLHRVRLDGPGGRAFRRGGQSPAANQSQVSRAATVCESRRQEVDVARSTGRTPRSDWNGDDLAGCCGLFLDMSPGRQACFRSMPARFRRECRVAAGRTRGLEWRVPGLGKLGGH